MKVFYLQKCPPIHQNFTRPKHTLAIQKTGEQLDNMKYASVLL